MYLKIVYFCLSMIFYLIYFFKEIVIEPYQGNLGSTLRELFTRRNWKFIEHLDPDYLKKFGVEPEEEDDPTPEDLDYGTITGKFLFFIFYLTFSKM